MMLTVMAQRIFTGIDSFGGMGALIAALRAILDPEDEVLVFEPHFPSYRTQITLAGGRICYVSTRFEDGFVPDPSRVEKAITPRTQDSPIRRQWIER